MRLIKDYIIIIRNIVADQLVSWAVDLYRDPDCKKSLAKWIVDNFPSPHPKKEEEK